MKILFKINRRRAIWGLVLALAAAYIVLSIAPNTFAKKGLEPMDNPGMLIVAHRGGAGLGPENTLSSIEKGLAGGADMIEVDVHLTKDGFLVVCHDQKVNRTTNGKGAIKEMTLAEIRELSVVDANGNITEEHLPTLSEVMGLVEGRAQLLVEIKKSGSLEPNVGQILLDELAKADAATWVVVQSFDDSVLESIHAISPQQRLEKLLFFKLPGLPVIFDWRFTRFSFEKYSHISSFNIMYPAASNRFVKAIHNHGKEVKIWTVNKPGKAPDLPVDGVITDRPDLWK